MTWGKAINQVPYIPGGGKGSLCGSEPEGADPWPGGKLDLGPKALAFLAMLDTIGTDKCPAVPSILIDQCVDECGQWTQYGLWWDKEKCAWREGNRFNGVIPVYLGAGQKLPEFSGLVEVCLQDGSWIELEGCQEIPETINGCLVMTGKVLDEDGNPTDKTAKPKFIPGKVTIPEAAPCPIRIFGDKPTAGSGVKLHINEHGNATFNQGTDAEPSFIGLKPTA